MTTLTVAAAIDQFGVDVDPHLDRDLAIPVLDQLQFQGDVAVVPRRPGKTARRTTTVPAAGIPVVRGESGGNTHLLLAAGECRWTANPGAGPTDLVLGTLTVPAGSTAYLAHPEHGYLGVAPGSYEIRRQREQADEIRMVAD